MLKSPCHSCLFRHARLAGIRHGQGRPHRVLDLIVPAMTERHYHLISSDQSKTVFAQSSSLSISFASNRPHRLPSSTVVSPMPDMIMHVSQAAVRRRESPSSVLSETYHRLPSVRVAAWGSGHRSAANVQFAAGRTWNADPREREALEPYLRNAERCCGHLLPVFSCRGEAHCQIPLASVSTARGEGIPRKRLH